MTMTTSSTCIIVDLTDTEGYPTGKSVPVELNYIVSVDHSYGEDADGQQSTTLVEYDILDMRIELRELLKLNSTEVEQAMTEAQEIFYHRQKHW